MTIRHLHLAGWLLLILALISVSDAAVVQAWVQRQQASEFSDSGGTSLIFDPHGQVIVSGFAAGDFYTAKYSGTNGALLWQKIFDAAGSMDFPYEVAVDQGGSIFVVGESYKGTNNYDFFTFKYSSDGTLLWQKRVQSPSGYWDTAASVALDSAGNAIVTGHCVDATGTNSFYTVKYSGADGTVLWDRRTPGAAVRVLVDTNDDVFITGNTYEYEPSFATTIYTAKLAGTNGALRWEQIYIGPNSNGEDVRGMVLDRAGNVIVTGYSTFFNEDYCTLKYRGTDGALLWEKRFNGAANGSDYGNAVAVDANDDVVVTGYSFNGDSDDYHTIKYSGTNGSVLWQQSFNGASNNHDRANSVVVDLHGDVVVAGYSAGAGGQDDYCTVKYAGPSGVLQWQKRYNGPANRRDQSGPRCLAVRRDGAVAVTGLSGLPLSGSSVLTVLYRESLPPLAINSVPTGWRFRFPAAMDVTYHLEQANSLVGPWTTNATFNSSTNQVIDYIDTNASGGVKFYRTSQPE